MPFANLVTGTRCFTNPSTVLLIAALLLGGCTKSMTMQIDTQVPVAAMETMSLNIGVRYTEAFRTHVYRENTEDRQNWEIVTGDSQVALFDQILNSLFGRVSDIDSLESSEADLMLLIEPVLDEMQLATPAETGFEFYEAWLKYTVNVVDKVETGPKAFSFTAYGKQNKARFTRLEKGLGQAIEQALRDAGAKLTVELMKIPQVRNAIIQ